MLTDFSMNNSDKNIKRSQTILTKQALDKIEYIFLWNPVKAFNFLYPNNRTDSFVKFCTFVF